MGVVGKVISSDSGCFLWIIDDFFSQAYQVYCNYNKTLESPKFSFSDFICQVKIELEREGRVSLVFRVHNDEPSRKLHVTLGMTTGCRGKKETRSGEVHSGRFYVHAWMQCSEMLERRREILSNGRLTVSCELRTLDIEESASVLSREHPSAGQEKAVVENEASESNSDDDEEEAIIDWKALRKLQKDLKNLLVTGEDSDVKIKVQGKEFPAHRYILRARSPVFRSMFSHEMVEKQSGVVVIDDCDPVTFPDFLKYVYTGSTRHICDGNVCQLYTASDKYVIDELRGECAEFMKNNLSIDIFCDTITLALRHNEKELVELAAAFFCANAREITKTSKWQVFFRENSTIGNELYIQFISNAKYF